MSLLQEVKDLGFLDEDTSKGRCIEGFSEEGFWYVGRAKAPNGIFAKPDGSLLWNAYARELLLPSSEEKSKEFASAIANARASGENIERIDFKNAFEHWKIGGFGRETFWEALNGGFTANEDGLVVICQPSTAGEFWSNESEADNFAPLGGKIGDEGLKWLINESDDRIEVTVKKKKAATDANPGGGAPGGEEHHEDGGAGGAPGGGEPKEEEPKAGAHEPKPTEAKGGFEEHGDAFGGDHAPEDKAYFSLRDGKEIVPTEAFVNDFTKGEIKGMTCADALFEFAQRILGIKPPFIVDMTFYCKEDRKKAEDADTKKFVEQFLTKVAKVNKVGNWVFHFGSEFSGMWSEGTVGDGWKVKLNNNGEEKYMQNGKKNKAYKILSVDVTITVAPDEIPEEHNAEEEHHEEMPNPEVDNPLAGDGVPPPGGGIYDPFEDNIADAKELKRSKDDMHADGK